MSCSNSKYRDNFDAPPHQAAKIDRPTHTYLQFSTLSIRIRIVGVLANIKAFIQCML